MWSPRYYGGSFFIYLGGCDVDVWKLWESSMQPCLGETVQLCDLCLSKPRVLLFLFFFSFFENYFLDGTIRRRFDPFQEIIIMA